MGKGTSLPQNGYSESWKIDQNMEHQMKKLLYQIITISSGHRKIDTIKVNDIHVKIIPSSEDA